MRSSDRPASFTRRVLPAIALTGISGVLLTQLDRPQTGVAIGRAHPSPTATRSSLPTRSSSANRANTTPATSAPTNNRPTSGATNGATTSVVPSGNCHGTNHQGPAADTRWGPVQVSAVVTSNGTICSATSTGPNDRQRSIFINEQALPILNEEAVSQGINFDAISGATVTSDGYRQSLQALLDSIKR